VCAAQNPPKNVKKPKASSKIISKSDLLVPLSADELAASRDRANGSRAKKDSDIRQELKRSVSSLTYSGDGQRRVRMVRSAGDDTQDLAINLDKVPGPKMSARIVPPKDGASEALPDPAEYAISCDPLGMPTDIEELDIKDADLDISAGKDSAVSEPAGKPDPADTSEARMADAEDTQKTKPQAKRLEDRKAKRHVKRLAKHAAKTGSGVRVKSFERLQARKLEKLERIAALSCVEPEIQ
jgi:hypothetical protein